MSLVRIVALDVGQKRIGVAMSDPLGITAQGLDTILREDDDALPRLIKEHGVTEIVVGLPLNMDGTEGERAKDARLYGDRLKEKVSLPVTMWDERLSTLQGEREMIRGDLSRRKRKGLSDRVAAQMILQNYLDSRRSHV